MITKDICVCGCVFCKRKSLFCYRFDHYVLYFILSEYHLCFSHSRRRCVFNGKVSKKAAKKWIFFPSFLLAFLPSLIPNAFVFPSLSMLHGRASVCHSSDKVGTLSFFTPNPPMFVGLLSCRDLSGGCNENCNCKKNEINCISTVTSKYFSGS